jgi:WW domain-binding protein 11
LQPSPLNEKVLKEKRKKLKETFDRVMRLLHEEELEQWQEIKRKEVEYEKRKYKRVQYYESVRHAEQVSIEDIPLPSSTSDKPIPSSIPKINLPPPILLTNVPPPSSLKKPDDDDGLQEIRNREPPGIPSSMPPNLFEMRELDSDYESEHDEAEEEEEIISKDDVIKDKHDKNIEEFMREVESVQKKKEEDRVLEMRIDPTPEVELEEKSEELSTTQDDASQEPPAVQEPEVVKSTPEALPIPSIPTMVSLPPRMPPHPHPLIFRPPPMRAGLQMGIRMPPGMIFC